MVAALPSELLYKITEELDPASLLAFIQTCSKFRNVFKREYYWKLRCCRDFPWFFWHGHCEADEIPLKLSVPDVDTVQVAGMIDMDGPVSDSVMESRLYNFGPDSTCQSMDCKAIAENPYHKLPNSFRDSYFLIATGRYSGLLQVLDSLENRQLSAYTAVATFNLATQSFLVSYRNSHIGMYRRGVMIRLKAREMNVDRGDFCDEEISIHDKGRLRRIPAPLLPFDPRENYSRELFTYPVSEDGRPLFYYGEEVEIQWKHMQNAAFAWWRAIVVQCYLHPRFAIPTESTTTLINEQLFEGSDQGILVLFPQYPPGSVWRYVVVSLFGNEMENARGFAGGIRKLTCKAHAKLWAYRYPLSLLSMQTPA